jgi:hypothetical protein
MDAPREHADNVEPLVVRPKQARALLGGCSNDELNKKIKNGDLESYLDGRRRLITVASIRADVARRAEEATARGFEYARGSRRPGSDTPQSRGASKRRRPRAHNIFRN